jgi:hypothetical protein
MIGFTFATPSSGVPTSVGAGTHRRFSGGIGAVFEVISRSSTCGDTR